MSNQNRGRKIDTAVQTEIHISHVCHRDALEDENIPGGEQRIKKERRT